MQTAVSWGLMFQVSPMTFLDRPPEDLPVLLACLDVADSRLRKAQKEAERGRQG